MMPGRSWPITVMAYSCTGPSWPILAHARGRWQDRHHDGPRHPRRAGDPLVRPDRPGPALAAARHLAVGGAGQRGDAAADPGRAGSTPVYEAWLRRWPTPADLAATRAGEAIRAWGRLGYPRRALRLHACAVAHRGSATAARCRPTWPTLLALPGVGDLHGPGGGGVRVRPAAPGGGHQRAPAGRPGVRRRGRRRTGHHGRPTSPPSRRCCRRHRRGPPGRAPPSWSSARWSAPPGRRPARDVRWRAVCAWRAAGRPPAPDRPDGQPAQPALRRHRPAGPGHHARPGPRATASIDRTGIDAAWPDADQRQRALAGLVSDGLLIVVNSTRYGLPGVARVPLAFARCLPLGRGRFAVTVTLLAVTLLVRLRRSAPVEPGHGPDPVAQPGPHPADAVEPHTSPPVDPTPAVEHRHRRHPPPTTPRADARAVPGPHPVVPAGARPARRSGSTTPTAWRPGRTGSRPTQRVAFITIDDGLNRHPWADDLIRAANVPGDAVPDHELRQPAPGLLPADP